MPRNKNNPLCYCINLFYLLDLKIYSSLIMQY